MGMPWVRLWNEILDKPKIMKLSPQLFRYWSLLLCIAQRHDRLGALPDACDLAFALRVTEQDVTDAIGELVKAKLLEKTASCYKVHDWTHWQSLGKTDAERKRTSRQRKRDKSRDTCVTDSVTEMSHAGPRAPSESESLSESLDGGAGGNPPAEVSALAATAEARWPAECADVFVGDLCKTFDHRLVCQVLNSAYDRDPSGQLPRAWVRAGCRNRFNEGWTPDTPRLTNGQADHGAPSPSGPTGALPPDIEAKVKAWEAENAKR